MKPSERIREIYEDWYENWHEGVLAGKIKSIVQYLDEEWEKNNKPDVIWNVEDENTV